MWQCLHWRNFSIMKENMMPNRMKRDMFSPKPPSPTASGIRWMKESPKRAPAEKLTRYRSTLLRVSLLTEKVRAPTKEIELTMQTLTKLYNHASMSYPARFLPFEGFKVLLRFRVFRRVYDTFHGPPLPSLYAQTPQTLQGGSSDRLL